MVEKGILFLGHSGKGGLVFAKWLFTWLYHIIFYLLIFFLFVFYSLFSSVFFFIYLFIYQVTPSEFFTPALADGVSLEFEW